MVAAVGCVRDVPVVGKVDVDAFMLPSTAPEGAAFIAVAVIFVAAFALPCEFVELVLRSDRDDPVLGPFVEEGERDPRLVGDFGNCIGGAQNSIKSFGFYECGDMLGVWLCWPVGWYGGDRR